MYRLRFLLILMRCWTSPPRSILSEFVLSFRAIPAFDADVSRLYTQTYSSWTALGRWHYVFSLAFQKAAVKNRWIPVTFAETVMFRKSIHIWEPVRMGNLRPQDVFDSFGERLVSLPMPPEVTAWHSMRNQ